MKISSLNYTKFVFDITKGSELMYIYYINVEFHNGDYVHFKETNKRTLLNKLIILYWFEYYECIPKKSTQDEILYYYKKQLDHINISKRETFCDYVEHEVSI